MPWSTVGRRPFLNQKWTSGFIEVGGLVFRSSVVFFLVLEVLVVIAVVLDELADQELPSVLAEGFQEGIVQNEHTERLSLVHHVHGACQGLAVVVLVQEVLEVVVVLLDGIQEVLLIVLVEEGYAASPSGSMK